MSFIEYLQALPWQTYVVRLIALILVWIVVWVLVRNLSRWVLALDDHIDSFDIDEREMRVLDRVLDYTVILIGTIITFSLLGVSEILYSALTAAGVMSIIIGFAVKDVAANFISGIFILLDQPFVSGDFIEIGNYSGTVRRVSLRSTEIVTLDGPVVAIPNSNMATEPTINYTVARERLISIKVAVPNDSDVGRTIQVLDGIAKSEDRLDAEKGVTILVDDIGEYAIDLILRCYASNDVWVQVESDLRQRIVEEFQHQGLELAVPVRKNLYPTAPTPPSGGIQ